MSIEKAKEFIAALKEMKPDEVLNEKAAAAKTEEEKIALAADIAHEMGYDVTEADLKEAMEQDDKDMVPLDDEDIESVRGGIQDWNWTGNKYCKDDDHNWVYYKSVSFWIAYEEIYRCTKCKKYKRVGHWGSGK